MKPLMKRLETLWAEEAEKAAERYADHRIAAVARAHAADLRHAIVEIGSQVLTYDEASELTDYSSSAIRRQVDAGRLSAAETADGKPGVFVCELAWRGGIAWERLLGVSLDPSLIADTQLDEC